MKNSQKNEFPRIGKTGPKVSNDWKNDEKSFQWLEKSLQKFPIGKMGEKTSNDWKNVPKSFQWLEIIFSPHPAPFCKHCTLFRT